MGCHIDNKDRVDEKIARNIENIEKEREKILEKVSKEAHIAHFGASMKFFHSLLFKLLC